MLDLFPSLPSIGPLPLLFLPAAFLLLLLLLSFCLLRHTRARVAAFAETPDYQIAQLAKNTRDYGVAYSELVFGKLLGKGSQGEVFRATWRGIAVAVKKVDTRLVPPEIVDEFCLDAEGQEILTSRGFMSLEQVRECAPMLFKEKDRLPTTQQHQQQQQKQPPLLFATYNPTTKQIEYHPASRATIVSSREWVNFSRQRRRQEKSSPTSQPRAGDFTLRVTPQHDMYVCRGKHVQRSEDDQEYAYQKVKAGDLVSDVRDSVQMLACASEGICTQETASQQSFLTSLNLTPSQLHSFLRVYGYWLDRHTNESPREISFTLQSEHVGWLRNQLEECGLVDGRDWCLDDLNHTISITTPSWVQHFRHALPSPSSIPSSSSHIPSWCSQLNKSQLRSLLSGLHLSNASHHIHQQQQEENHTVDQSLFVTSTTLRDELLQLLLHAGYSSYFELVSPNSDSLWRIIYSDDFTTTQPIFEQRRDITSESSSEEESSERTAWCVTVPPHHLIIARQITRDSHTAEITSCSSPLIVGNCSEADIMRRLRHPSTTLFMGVSLEHPYLCIVTEIVNRGALFEILHEDSTGFTWKRALQIMVDVASGMTYLHSFNPPILHRDLKSLNILIASNWRAKVADFGMTRFQATPNGKPGEEEQTMTQCGSPIWMAPEMIKNEAYDEKADVFSFSIVLWELYTRRVPYRELNLSPSILVVKVVRDGLRPHIPKGCPRKFKDLLRRCWNGDASKRPKFTEILKILEGFMLDKEMMRHKPKYDDDEFEEGVEGGGEEEEEEEEEEAEVLPTSPSGADGLSGAHYEAALLQDEYEARQNEVTNMVHDGWQLNEQCRDDLEVSNVRLLGMSEMKTSGVMTTTTSGGSGSNYTPPVTTVTESSSSSSSNQRSQSIYKAKYRGKNVIVKKCALAAVLNKKLVIELLRRTSALRHPNLVLFMGAYISPPSLSQSSSDQLVTIIEEDLSLRGTLSSLLQQELLTNTLLLEWEQTLQILIDITNALIYLSSEGIVHPDLNTKNVLLTQNYRAKVTGAVFVDLERKVEEMSTGTAAGSEKKVQEVKTNIWSAPETFSSDDSSSSIGASSQRTSASNVYSFSLLMWSVIMKKLPYDGKFGPKLRKKVQEGFRLPVPNSITPRFKALMKSCWSSDVLKRPSFSEILTVLTQIKQEGPPMIKLDEKNSKVYRKSATVFAYASKDPLTFLKDTGKNRGEKGNMLVASSLASASSIAKQDAEYFSSFTDLAMWDAEVFHRTYELTKVHAYEYRKRGTVRARKMEEPFAIRTGVGSDGSSSSSAAPITDGSIEQGIAGDYIVQNDAGDQWITDGKTMETVYIEIPSAVLPGGSGGDSSNESSQQMLLMSITQKGVNSVSTRHATTNVVQAASASIHNSAQHKKQPSSSASTNNEPPRIAPASSTAAPITAAAAPAAKKKIVIVKKATSTQVADSSVIHH